MDEHKTPPLQIFPAPYVANTERLISAAADVEHRVFYRAGTDNLRGLPVDYFAAGNFVEHEIPWKIGNRAIPLELIKAKLSALNARDGALAGYISYETGFAFEPDKWGQLPRPDRGYAWRFVQLPCWYEANHATATGRICAVSHADPEAIAFLIKLVEDNTAVLSTKSQPGTARTIDEIASFGEISIDTYKTKVLEVLEDIQSGRYYELNLTQRFRLESSLPPSELFTRLFAQLEPRRGFFCTFKDETIVGVSPELFIKKACTRISTRPIKGSISGPVSALDKIKLSAEHVMVVDLARNDLGRVSDTGWVNVEEYQSESKFGSLTHLESLITGSTSMTWQNILANTFPAASITGMPKIIVVQSIAQYELSCRGVYTGACGWIFPNGDFDFNVSIRTFAATPTRGSWRYEIGAGGAITADSKPADEYLECLNKVQPLISAAASE